VEQGHETVTRVKLAHSEHYETLEQIQKELSKRDIEYRAVARVDLTTFVTGVDLVISVGGDGTFLDASHYVQSIPLLGVNSSRSSSFGHFCLANESNLGAVLEEIESDDRQPLRLLRLELELNGSALPELVLNEVLVCHSNPAGTSRYFIEIGNLREEQRSGGIWIGTPAGSTGALRAAGADILPIGDDRIVYKVREPGPRPSECWQLLGGLIARDQQIRVISQMRTGSLFIDGQHIDYGFGLGDELIVSASGKDLIAFVSASANDIFCQ
jgi:NAD+ kinase